MAINARRQLCLKFFMKTLLKVDTERTVLDDADLESFAKAVSLAPHPAGDEVIDFSVGTLDRL